ncbi:hypothetical protein KQX54_007061 [Cotesia glomerata]|uniref:Uncharacterized protein n=1 Tax=Cotesia glomerata TaxID=32391 RepID=A0AAV7IV33_COTGL|nr:hypothetical protein KQX54_007061 [Cotesia glomerata]
MANHVPLRSAVGFWILRCQLDNAELVRFPAHYIPEPRPNDQWRLGDGGMAFACNANLESRQTVTFFALYELITRRKPTSNLERFWRTSGA